MNAKELRSQIRNLIPEVLENELVAAAEKRILAEVTRRLDIIDQRQKDIQGYIIRNSAMPTSPKSK